MNYPVKIKKVYSYVKYQAHDAWQNLKELKKDLLVLNRKIDSLGEGLGKARIVAAKAYSGGRS